MQDAAGNAGPNVRSVRYFIVEGRTLCLQCNVVTAVFTFALPAGYESLFESGEWEAPGAGVAGVLCYVEYLPEAVARRIQALTSHYRIDLHEGAGRNIWMNHCEHCGAQIEEEELHGEPEGAFGPVPHEGLESIRLHDVREPFEAWAGGEAHDLKPLNG